MQKIVLFIFLILFVSKSFSQNLFNPNDIINNPKTEQLLKEIIKNNDPKYKIKKENSNGNWYYSIRKKGKDPYEYTTNDNSFSVNQFHHWTSLDFSKVIQFYKKSEYILYVDKEIGTGCTRFKNKAGTIFVHIYKLPKNKCSITISGIDLDCNCDL
jgi:hypothetical protein